MSDTKKISPQSVKELRERTAAGIMECKKALTKAGGDIEKAVVCLRESGQAKAVKRAGRVATEGVIEAAITSDGRRATLLEINCETDFVARDTQFKSFTEALVSTCTEHKYAAVAELLAHKLSDGRSLDEMRADLVAKIGENIQLRRLLCIESDHALGVYQHGARIAACVALQNEDVALAKDMAMQVAATNPAAVTADDVDPALIAKERDIFVTQAQTSGKPEALQEKIVAGQVDKFIKAQTLLGQAFIKNPDQKVAQLLAEKNNQVVSFIRLEVGEGIEKEEQDFASEVQAQLKAADK